MTVLALSTFDSFAVIVVAMVVVWLTWLVVNAAVDAGEALLDAWRSR